MKNALFILLLSLSSTVLAVTGGGTGSNVQVTGGGTGANAEVTGGGTGSNVQVTGNGTGASREVTGNGTGASREVTGNGTGREVTGGGTGREVTGGGTGREVTGGGTGSPNAEVGIDACYSGSWYDPAIPAEGINVEVLEDQVLVYFYTYDPSGAQTWYVFQGSEGDLTAYDSTGDGVADIGSGAFEPTGDNAAIFSWNFDLDLDRELGGPGIPWCLSTDCSGVREYVRLSQPIPCAAETEVTGNGTGASREVTGNGTGASREVTGNGTGSNVEVTGNGTGRR